jgi:hypothetical protein
MDSRVKTRRTRHRLAPGAARGNVSSQATQLLSSTQRILSRKSSSPTLEILIATPRLEILLTDRKQSPLTFSNRDYDAVFQFHPLRSALPLSPGLVLPLITDHSPARQSDGGSLITAFLIETPRLEILVTATKQSSATISNRDKSPFFQPPMPTPNVGKATAPTRSPNESLCASVSLWQKPSASLTLLAPASNLAASGFVRDSAGEQNQ